MGAGSEGESSVHYKALLRRRDGSIVEILPYGVDKITGNAASLNLSKAKALFPSVASTLESPAGLSSYSSVWITWRRPQGKKIELKGLHCTAQDSAPDTLQAGI